MKPRLQCDCGSDELFAIKPGSEPEDCDLFTVTRGEPLRCWCRAHYPLLAPVAEEARA